MLNGGGKRGRGEKGWIGGLEVVDEMMMRFAHGTRRERARQDKRWSSTGVLHCDTGYLALINIGLKKRWRWWWWLIDLLMRQVYARGDRSMQQKHNLHGLLDVML